MKILVVGGGSGGHVTPALAILESLVKQVPNLEVCFVCDKKFAPQAQTILASASMPITFTTVSAGKFRRYHGVSIWRQLLDLPTVLQNIADVFRTGAGVMQSLRLLGKFKPDVVFGKGGFVCMPVGIAAHLKKIPLVIHDSDAHPGLTNRVLAPWASAIATGAPLENYTYDRTKSVFVGIPVADFFHEVASTPRATLKQALELDASRPLVVVVGGGLGAKSINDAMAKSATALVNAGLTVVHVTGAAHAKAVGQAIAAALHTDEQRRQYQVKPFIDAKAMATLLAAADVVVSRGGATAIAELSLLKKPTVLVPGAQLTGGQQLKNAKALAAANAIITASDAQLQEDYTILQQHILQLTHNVALRQSLAQAIGKFARPQAASQVAQMIVAAAGQGNAGQRSRVLASESSRRRQ